MSRPLTENDPSPFSSPDAPRGGSENLALDFVRQGFVRQGVRSVSVRFVPTMHGAGDQGFAASVVGIARTHGVSVYVGDGSNRWPAVHRSDAARLVLLRLDASAGSVLHAVAEGVVTRDIAAAIGRGLSVRLLVRADEAIAHFGWLGGFFGMDVTASSDQTRRLLGWAPTGPTLLEDLDAGAYFRG